MKNIWKKHLFHKCLALFLSVILLLSGISTARAVDFIYSDKNHHYLMYNDIDTLFDKMVKAYEENNLAIIGENVFLPIDENSLIESGEELLVDIYNKLIGKYLIDTINVSDGLTLYLTADVITFEIYLLVSNTTNEEHSFTILFTEGMEFEEIAQAYSFDITKIVEPVQTASGGAIIVDIEDEETPSTPVNEEGEETPSMPVNEEGEETPSDPSDEEDEEIPSIPVDEEDEETPSAPADEEDENTDSVQLMSLGLMNDHGITTRSFSMDTMDIDNEDESQEDEFDNEDENQEDELDHEDENQEDELDHEDENQEDELDHEDENQEDELDHEDESQEDELDNEDESQEDELVNEDESQEDELGNEDESQEDELDSEDENQEDQLGNEDGSDEDEPEDLFNAIITSQMALNTLMNLSLTFTVAPSSVNTINGMLNDIPEVNPTIDKTGQENGDGSYTINLSVTGDQKVTEEIIKESSPINLVFAVDISASMDWALGGQNANGTSRWKLLVNQMNAMVDYVLSSNTGNANSKISIIAYSNANISSSQANAFSTILINSSSNINDIKNSYSRVDNGTRVAKSLSSIRPNNFGMYTNNHAGFLGVKEHLRVLTANNDNKTYVIYLTDGEANRYLSLNNGTYKEESGNNSINAALAEARSIKPTFPNETIKIFTIGIGNDSNQMAVLLNPSSNPYQDRYYSINNVGEFDQIFTDLSKEITETNIVYVTDMIVTDTLSDYVTLEPNSYRITFNGAVVYDNSDPTNVINVNHWPQENLPQYNSTDRSIRWSIQNSDGKLGSNQTYVLSYNVTVNNENLSSAPPSDLYYAYYDDWNNDGIREIRYYNAEQALARGLTEEDRADFETYYPSNDYAELEYNDGKIVKTLVFPHPAVKADATGTLIITKNLTESSDSSNNTEFIFRVEIGENDETPTLYEGTTEEGHSIVNGILKLKEGQLATIKLTTLKASYVVTELTYVDESGYSESTLDHVQREEVKTVSRGIVSNGIVNHTSVPDGDQVAGNLYTDGTQIVDGTDGHWESRDIDNGIAGNWREITVDTSEEVRIRSLSQNAEDSYFEMGKLLSNGSLEQQNLPTPNPNVNGHYDENGIWKPWSSNTLLSYTSGQTRLSNGTRQYYYNNNYRTAAYIYSQNNYKNYDGYVEFTTGSGQNRKYNIRFYKLLDTSAYNDIREYRFVPGTDGSVTRVTSALDVTLNFTNQFTAIDGRISVGKVIDEFLPQHGNATFFFSLDKLDEDGNVINSYLDYLEFDSKTNNNLVLFDHLPKGTYRLTELQPIRYEFESVSAEGANAEWSEHNVEVIFHITGDDQEGFAKYSNNKIYDKYYSHTAVKRNTITINIDSSSNNQ